MCKAVSYGKSGYEVRRCYMHKQNINENGTDTFYSDRSVFSIINRECAIRENDFG